MFAVATNQTGFLPDEGKYTVECLRIEEAPDNGFGVGVRWVLALYEGDQRVKNDGGYDYEFWQTTSPNMGPKARARQYVEAFLGRPLEEGERINPNDLPGLRCTGMVIHEESKTKVGVMNAKLVSVKPLANAAPKPKTAPAPATVNLDGLRSILKKKIRQSEVLQSPEHLTWIALNVDAMDADDLNSFISSVQADLDAA